MSVNASDDGCSMEGYSKVTQTDGANFLIISLKDMASVDAAAHWQARGLKSRIVPVNTQRPDSVAYVHGNSHKLTEAIANAIVQQASRVRGANWMKASAAIAVGSITTWETLACL